MVDCQNPVLSGEMLKFFRENCKLLRTGINIPANADSFCTTPILAPLQGDQREIARRIFARLPVAKWNGTFILRSADETTENAAGRFIGPRTIDRVLRPVFPEIPEDFVSDIDKVLEYLQVDAGQDININRTQPPQFGPPTPSEIKQRQRAIIMGQIVDCWVPSDIPPKFAQVFKQAFRLFQDEDAFNAQGGIPDMTDLYAYFWSQPWASMNHFNCLVRILGRGNVVLSEPDGTSVYSMGFSEDVVKQVLTFLQVETGWSEWTVDEVGKGYAFVVYTQQQAEALYRRFPVLDGLFSAAERFPLTLGIEDFPGISIERMKLFIKLLKGEPLGKIDVRIVIETPKKSGLDDYYVYLPPQSNPAFARFTKYHAMKQRGFSAKNIRNRMEKNKSQGLLSFKNYTLATEKPPATTQEKLNALPVRHAELILKSGMPVFKKLEEGVGPEDISFFIKFLGIATPQQFVKAFDRTALFRGQRLVERLANQNRQGVVGHVGRRTERRLRNMNRNYNRNDPRYHNRNNREGPWNYNYGPENNSESESNYNATKGRRLTRQQEERLNRDPWESNNEGGGRRRKTRRNRK